MRRISLPRSRVILLFCAVLAGTAGTWLWWRKIDSGIPKSTAYCTTEVLSEEKVDSMQFEIVDVACDTLAKDETVRVYALAPLKSWPRGSSTQATLLFEYDPGQTETLPHIAADSGGTLTISVPSVSSVIQTAKHWQGRSIRYSIDHIEYP